MAADDEFLKVKLLERTQRMLTAQVAEVMTADVVTVDATDLTAKAARLILDNGILGVLVMKDGHPYNLVNSVDLLRLAYEEVLEPERDFLRMTVGDLIREKEFLSVRSDMKVREMLNIMVERRLRAIAVIDEGFLKGVVSLTDLVRWYRDTHAEVRTGHL